MNSGNKAAVESPIVLTMDDVIDANVIEACKSKGACDPGLNWLLAKSRTFARLRCHSMGWWKWLAANVDLAEVLTLLSADSNAYVRCEAKKSL
jgi:hypothetical protein